MGLRGLKLLRAHALQRRRLGLSALLCAFVFFLLTECSHSEAEYFVFCGTTTPGDMGPAKVIIYRLDSAANRLDQVWTMPDDDYFCGVKQYPGSRVMAIFAGPWGYREPDRLYVVPFDSVSSLPVPIVDHRKDSVTLTDCQYVANGDGQSLLRVLGKSQSDTVAGEHREELFFDLSTRRTINTAALSSNARRRLAGSGPGLWTSQRIGEVERIQFSREGDKWVPLNRELLPDSPPLLDSVIQMKTAYGWNLIANEPEFYVVASIPDRSGLTSKELLIYNRVTGTWGSTLIPGPRTTASVLRHKCLDI